MKWFLDTKYDDTIQPKGRTARNLAERLAKEYRERGIKVKIVQEGNFWEVYVTNRFLHGGTWFVK